MALKPKPETIPQIRGALKFYQVCAYITGTMLLLLVAEMIVKYGFFYELQLGGTSGFLGFVPWDPSGRANWVTGVNLSTGILIAHGWLYVLYLFSDFRLWSLMRWPFSRFVIIALGGVVPFLSFIVEHFMARRVNREIAELEQPVAVGVSD